MHSNRMKHLASTFVLAMIALTVQASAFVLPAHKSGFISVDGREKPVVFTALNILQSDLKRVLDYQLLASDAQPNIIVGSVNGPAAQRMAATGIDLSWLQKRRQAFIMAVNQQGQLVIAGSDSYGAAYGIIELTRHLGVSPWEWWADVVPDTLSQFQLEDNFVTRQEPDVSFRGIFINDEDWGLLPWATRTFEPNQNRAIGPKTTRRIFELMLRLRANLYWPPMHECTRPFFMTFGNKELASSYGIYIGTSHCEPLACNAAGEWAERGKGEYDWIHNRKNVLAFWEKRVRETAYQPMVYTLGMRGLHDGAMQGVKSANDQKKALEQIIKAQRELLAKNVNKNVHTLPQVFIPYKEVLDAYNAGLQIPEDVTLMWTDDNYGYIRHFPTEKEQQRLGGNGIYYHVSYWGRPHDYLWLATASPYLMYQQLSEAYYHGAYKMWVLNVGDIKPAEYQIQLFMDMAWNIDSIRTTSVNHHLEEFCAKNIGRDIARLSSIYLKEHYNLAFQMKPEHLAGTRVEEPKESETDWNAVQDLPWSEAQIRKRLSRYDLLQRNTLWVADSVRRKHPERYDAFYELVEYPILAAAAQNEKYLCAQLARHGRPYLQADDVAATWNRSDLAHNRVQELTLKYNAIGADKWQGIMSSNPRNLTVFQPVPHQQVSTPLKADEPAVTTFYGASYNASSFSGAPILDPVLGLGASIRAMPLPRDCNLTYKYRHNYGAAKTARVEIRVLPTHPINEQQRFTVALDDCAPVTCTFETEGRSEQWKQNVLQGFATVLADLPVVAANGEHSLVIAALDDGIVIDEIFIRP